MKNETKLMGLSAQDIEFIKANPDDFLENEAIFSKLYDHYCSNGEMPYGTMKARTGDPDTWIYDKVWPIFQAEGIIP